MQHTVKRSIKKSHLLRSLHSIHAIHDYFTDMHHNGTLWINIHAGRRCATNADCRLAYRQVNEVNIVMKALTDFLSLNFWVFYVKAQFRDTKSFLPASMQACSLRSSHTASPAMIARHVQRAQRFHKKSRLLFKFSTAFAWGSNSPPPGRL